MQVSPSIKSEAKLLKRRHFPSFLKLNYRYDVKALRKELKILEEINGWGDMDHGSSLVQSLLENRSHLAECFQDEKGGYTKYRQIILTDHDRKEEALPKTQVISGNERYKYDVSLKNSFLDEGRYNQHRAILKHAPCFTKILDCFAGELMRARIAKISPKFQIKPHIDYDLDYGIRLHLALYSNPKCFVYVKKVGDQDYQRFRIPVDGHLYFLNTGYSHYADNFGESDRTHLVLSLRGQSTIWQHRLEK